MRKVGTCKSAIHGHSPCSMQCSTCERIDDAKVRRHAENLKELTVALSDETVRPSEIYEELSGLMMILQQQGWSPNVEEER